MESGTADAKNKSDRILEEIMRRKEKDRVVDVEQKKVKVVIFSLQEAYYAFYGEHIKEILPLITIYYVPGTAEYIPGVINVRGEIESVININRFLGIPDAANGQGSRIALAVANGIRSGILVDAIEDVIDIQANSIKPPLDALSKTMKEFVAGEFIHRERLITILDIGKIFGKIAL